jgi:hypothetical protein
MACPEYRHVRPAPDTNEATVTKKLTWYWVPPLVPPHFYVSHRREIITRLFVLLSRLQLCIRNIVEAMQLEGT